MAERVFLNKPILYTLLDEKDLDDIKKISEEINKRNFTKKFEENKIAILNDEIWYSDNYLNYVLNKAIIKAEKIITENIFFMNKIIETCMLKSNVTKQDFDFINQ